jgi:hypothetical protein
LQIGNQLADQAVPAGLALALNLKSKRKHGVVVRMAQPSPTVHSLFAHGQGER